jgi:hypothetical protein
LSHTREARGFDSDAAATGAFGATLTAIGLAVVGVSFAGPIVLDHSATGTCRSRSRFSKTIALRFFNSESRFRFQFGGHLSKDRIDSDGTFARVASLLKNFAIGSEFGSTFAVDFFI